MPDLSFIQPTTVEIPLVRSSAILRHAKGQPYKRGKPQLWLLSNSRFAGSECLIWPFGCRDNGYGVVTFNGRRTSAHRAMCEIVNGPPPEPNFHAAHSCGNGAGGCVNPSHLSWKSPLANKADELVHGTRNFGTRNGHSKLTKSQVLEMRKRFDEGHVSISRLAQEYGVHPGTAREVVRRMTWKWV